MSIIHEALKKAGKRREGLYRLIEHEPIEERLHIERPDRVKRYAVVIIIALGALNASIFAWNFSLKSEMRRIASAVIPPETKSGERIDGASTEERSLHAEPAEHGREAEDIARAETAREEEPPAADVSLPELDLKGTMLSKSKSRAFINDSMVKVGDEIEGAEVLSIRETSVTLRKGEKEFEIHK